MRSGGLFEHTRGLFLLTSFHFLLLFVTFFTTCNFCKLFFYCSRFTVCYFLLFFTACNFYKLLFTVEKGMGNCFIIFIHYSGGEGCTHICFGKYL